MHARGSRQIEKLSSSYQAEANLDRSRIYGPNRKFLDGSRICREAIETNSQKLRWIKIALTSIEKGRFGGLIDSLAIERYREVAEMSKNSF